MKNRSVAKIVEDELAGKPFLEDFLAQGLINQSALARKIFGTVQKQSEEANSQAIVMAIKRYSAELKPQSFEKDIKTVLSGSTLNLKSGIADIAVEKTNEIFSILGEISKDIDTKRGEMLSLIQGVSEMAIILDEKHAPILLKKLHGKKILKQERGLVALQMLAPPKFWDTPGVIYYVTKKIALAGINLIDIVTTPTELSVLVKKADAGRAFDVMSAMIEEAKTS